MSLLQAPKVKATKYYMLKVDHPCFNGINLQDLEYKQGIEQSPNSLNMMYRNGAFGKRYGQEVNKSFDDTIYRIGIYQDSLIIHSGTKIYKGDDVIANDIPEEQGMFINFNKLIYYMCGKKYYQYDGETWKEVEPYIPDVLINRKPNPEDGKGDTIDDFNRLGSGFNQTFDGDGKSKDYYLYNGTNSSQLDEFDGDGTKKTFELSKGKIVTKITEVLIDNVVQASSTYTFSSPNLTFNTAPKSEAKIKIRYPYYDFLPYDDKSPIIKVTDSNGERELTTSEFTFDRYSGKITFTTAPAEGTNNVVITAYKTDQDYIDSILKNKIWIAYGGSANSRLFFAGGGDSNYYYSDVYDATYFPENSYAAIGNTEDDITGFGEQYDTLIIFKPKETFSLSYELTKDSDGNYTAEFTSLLVNSRIGCDCPNTIQLINNLLVWCSTEAGVCTLVSTNIEDERNIRYLSYNIESGYRGNGLLKEDNLKNATSCDWNGKYFLTVNGKVYMWDYLISPFWASNLSSSAGQNNEEAKRLSWFIFDNFNVNQYQVYDNELYYSKENDLVKLNKSFNDFGEAINAYYQTPLYQFGAVEYLKTIKNLYVQCRADTATVIDIKYITEDNPDGEQDPESIYIGSKLWEEFTWDTFGWGVVNFGHTFRRKCSMKKVQMFGIMFSNNQKNRDMSISHIGLEYRVVKAIK